eukprot:14248879-Alexandrium_andersonii.AAC.1
MLAVVQHADPERDSVPCAGLQATTGHRYGLERDRAARLRCASASGEDGRTVSVARELAKQ